ncbi:MAG: GPW/gp25 family protein [Saprospiraceae bacterium]|nr:GPW/gp25 family protein [Saprospiraceae bacterium]
MESSFLGTGWSFPPSFDKAGKTVNMVNGVEDIHQSLEILLSTSIGERVMQPSYGCNMADFQFEPLNNSMIGYLKDLVERAILFHEPRIVVERITVTQPDDFELIEGRFFISVDYLVAGTNSRYNYVYDYYLREANQPI